MNITESRDEAFEAIAEMLRSNIKKTKIASKLAADYCVSDKTVYKWITRVEEIDNILSEPDPKTKLAKAEANLPNTEGFFFGGQEYDKYYFEDLKYTKERMQACLDWQNKMAGTGKCFDSFYYQSSW